MTNTRIFDHVIVTIEKIRVAIITLLSKIPINRSLTFFQISIHLKISFY